LDWSIRNQFKSTDEWWIAVSPFKDVIIGAGLAGLTAAIDLAGMGRNVIVLEKAEVIGGHACSKMTNGYIHDIGFHVIIPDAIPLYEMVKTAGIENDLTRFDMKFGFLKNRRAYSFSPDPLSLMKFRLLSVRDKIKLGLLMKGIEGLSEEHYSDMTAEEFVTEKVSEKALRSFFEPLLTRLSGIPLEALSAAFLIAFSKMLVQVKSYELCYPRRGIGKLAEGMASRIEALGAVIKTDSEVKEIVTDGNQVTGVVYRQDEVEKEIEASNVVSTVHFRDLPKIIDLPREYENKLKEIEYTEFTIAYFGVDTKLSDYDMEVMIPREENFCINSFVEVSNIAKEVAPEKKSLLSVLTTPHTIQKRSNDEEILDAITEDLSRLFPELEERINWRKLIRQPFTAITKEYMSLKPEFVTPIKGLYLAGAQMYPLQDMATAVVSGHIVSDIIKERDKEHA